MTAANEATLAVAAPFVAMLKTGDHDGAAAKFNSPDIVSFEAMDGPMARVQGAAAVKAKGEWWAANHEVANPTVEGPFVHGDQFLVRFEMDVTVKATGQKMHMVEAGLYTVKAGRIVEEKFYYLMG